MLANDMDYQSKDEMGVAAEMVTDVLMTLPSMYHDKRLATDTATSHSLVSTMQIKLLH